MSCQLYCGKWHIGVIIHHMEKKKKAPDQYEVEEEFRQAIFKLMRSKKALRGQNDPRKVEYM